VSGEVRFGACLIVLQLDQVAVHLGITELVAWKTTRNDRTAMSCMCVRCSNQSHWRSRALRVALVRSKASAKPSCTPRYQVCLTGNAASRCRQPCRRPASVYCSGSALSPAVCTMEGEWTNDAIHSLKLRPASLSIMERAKRRVASQPPRHHPQSLQRQSIGW
jgi:hypothetical protein